MSAKLERLLSDLLCEIDNIVDRKVEEKLPEMIRALGIRDAEIVSDSANAAPTLVGAIEISRLLGFDVSSPAAINRSNKHVYNLARKELIPSVRISPRCVRFDLTKVREVVSSGGLALPYTRAA